MLLTGCWTTCAAAQSAVLVLRGEAGRRQVGAAATTAPGRRPGCRVARDRGRRVRDGAGVRRRCISCARRCSTASTRSPRRSGRAAASRSACVRRRRPTGSWSGWPCSACCPTVGRGAAAAVPGRRRAVARPRVGAGPRRSSRGGCWRSRSRWSSRFASRATSASWPGCRSCAVEGSATSDARALLASAIPGPLDERVRDRIVAETRGNPLALLELPRGLTPAELAGGFGLPDAAAAVGPDRGELPAPARRAARRHAAAAAARRGRAGRRPGCWSGGRPSGSGIAPRRASPAEAARAARRSARGCGSAIRWCARPSTGGVAADRRAVHRALAEVDRSRGRPRSPRLASRRRPRRARRGRRRRARALGRPRAGARRARRGGRVPASGRRADARPGAPRGARAGRGAGQAPGRRARCGAGAAGGGGGGTARRARARPGRPAARPDRVRLDRGQRRSAAAAAGGPAARAARRRRSRARPTSTRWRAALFAGHLAGARRRCSRSSPGRARRRARGRIRRARPTCCSTALRARSPRATPPGARRCSGRWTRSARATSRRGRGCAGSGWRPAPPRACGTTRAGTRSPTRQVQLARDAGALACSRWRSTAIGVHGCSPASFASAASLLDEADAVTEATGSRLAPYGALALAAWRGREAEARGADRRHRAEARPRGEGIGLTVAHWATAVLYNGLGRYERGAGGGAARPATTPTSSVLAPWALPELVEAAVRSGAPEPAADALDRLASDDARQRHRLGARHRGRAPARC